MIFPAIEDWNDAYTNGAHIAGGDAYPGRWAEAAAAFRDGIGAIGSMKLDLSYGAQPRNKLDLFLPTEKPWGLFVFVHGGYWMRFDKSHWSHLAEGAVRRGFAVAMQSYTLCPDIGIAGIAREVAEAVSFAAREVEGPIYLAGHSAGGHLVSRLMAAPALLPEEVQRRIAHVVSISGLHDLRPLMKTTMNETLKIEAVDALAESPALLEPLPSTRITCWVGAAERAEFIRQNALLANVWRGLGAATAEIVEANRHHFDVIEGLTDPRSPLTAALFEA
ncbi:alpha/beta hydrolase [Aestuariivirga sp. YIM B02566]|uniref:Alpha/beta hydrolase n=1 Tax=Taklimakanibacter albus TaxID=2800327 RepID=A0ACC5R6L9_9HYPH|nr:alpha/beta hydrolase [Aestuariivirga sp. YIM B02566]MBK1868218.1 alpha/beta hydrolase [Aestuariivirga sp. YIM B02566]